MLTKLSERVTPKDKPTRYYSDKQEKSIAKAIGGKQTANSGAGMFAKSDVSTDEWIFEAKTCTTDKESFSIKKAWLDKNLQESVFMGKKYNALVFNFGPGQKNYYVIDELTFKELIEKD